MKGLDRLRASCGPDVIALNEELFGTTNDSAPAKRNKYNAHKITVDGLTFDSKKEYLRWADLTRLQAAGVIQDLQRQVKFVLQESFVDGEGKRCREISYTADYTYTEDGRTVIEDCKSVITAKSESFRVRWRMLLSKFKDDSSVICNIFGA